MAVLINGDGFSPVTAQMDADFYAGIWGEKLSVIAAGSNMEASIESATTVRIADGEAIIQGRRIHIDAGSFDEFTIPVGSQGTTAYYVIGYELYRDNENKELCRQFVQEVNSASATVPAGGVLRDGATSIKAAMYRVTKEGVNIGSVTALFDSPRTLKNYAYIFSTKEQLGYNEPQTAGTYRMAMPDNSMAILKSDDVSGLPANKTGVVVIKRVTSNRFTIDFFTYSTLMNLNEAIDHYTTLGGGWFKMPGVEECMYLYGYNYRWHFTTAGYISTGGKSVFFTIPVNKSLREVNAIDAGGGMMIKVRQRGKYLYGDGSTYASVDSVTYRVAENCILATATVNAGFGGINNEACGIDGYCDVIIN